MKTSKALMILAVLAGLLAVVISSAGLFWQAPGTPFDFTTLRGQTVQIYGQGLYQYDTYFRAPIFRGTDAVTLVLCVPLLGIALAWYARSAPHGSQKGLLFLTGLLAYLLYNAASVTFGVAYNNLFIVYIAYFSTSLFAFCLACSLVDVDQLAGRLPSSSAKPRPGAQGRAGAKPTTESKSRPGLPNRGMAILLFLSGGAVLLAWMTDLIGWLAPGAVPGIGSYTTEVTHAIDLAIIAPMTALSGVLLLRRAPVGYLYASILLTILVIIGVDVTVQTVFQTQAGITLTPGELVGKAGSFALLSLFAVGLLVRFYQALPTQEKGR